MLFGSTPPEPKGLPATGVSDPSSAQGPTSFREDAGPHVVTYPLHHGTSDREGVGYVITDASDLQVARELGVNYTPKLQQALGTSAVEMSSSFLSDDVD
jgi:hypothetical protein